MLDGGDWDQRGDVDGQKDRRGRGETGLALEVEGVDDRVGGECLDRPGGELRGDRPSPKTWLGEHAQPTAHLDDLVAQPAHHTAEASMVGALGPGEQCRAGHNDSDDRDGHGHDGDQRDRVAA